MNKKEFQSFREVILGLAHKIADEDITISSGKNMLVMKHGVIKYGDRLGIDKKYMPNYYYEIGTEKYMTAGQLKEVESLVDIHAPYIIKG